MGTVTRLLLAAVFFCVGAGASLAADFSVEVQFDGGEAETIRAWFDDHGFEGNRGKGRKALPPGIAKNLRRGKPLPPGIAKQALPADLVSRLPPVREGYERVIVDGKVLLVEVATQIIHDVLVDVILD
ncbi:MAG TPA: anti-virulence regulator CigR family protein [Woeseiaceae bacterium]|nr:anti-virulence regulator CigR family protein [Woeseiaceae bacterium]